MNLYSEHAKSFSSKRWTSWKGWEKLVPELKNLQPLKILDLGCGNGRLLEAVVGYRLEVAEYTGIDSSKELLEIANEKLRIKNEKFLFLNLDLETEGWELKTSNSSLQPGTYNLVAAFGLMHHISTFEKRIEILKKSVELLEENGLIIITFWQFGSFPEFLQKHLIDDLGNNDFNLSWGGNKNIKRFCHHFTDEEIEEIKSKINLPVIKEFSADGVENKMNRYILWQKK